MSEQLPLYGSRPVARRTLLSLGATTAWRIVLSLSVIESLAAGYRAPGTARDQLIFFSEEKELEFGLSAYREVLRQARLSKNSETNDMVQRVGQRIANASNKPEYQWEFAVIDDDKTINAFALPGGKVAVFTGMLKVTKSGLFARERHLTYGPYGPYYERHEARPAPRIRS